jgi:4-oxalocrotonate tautomerase
VSTKDVFSAEQKRELIEKVTVATVSVEGKGLHGVTWVCVQEFEQGHCAICGTPLSARDVKAMAA